jgi:hypothetical protein
MIFGDAARAGHSRPPFIFGTRTGLAVGLFSRPGRGVSPSRRRPWDSRSLRSVAPRPRVSRRLVGALAPTCRFATAPAASFIVAGPARNLGRRHERGAAAPGVWPRGRSRAVVPVGPARAFVHRAKTGRRPGLPWAFRPLPGFRRRPPHLASKASTARGLLARLGDPPAVSGRRFARALRRVRGRRLIGPPVLPTDRHPA